MFFQKTIQDIIQIGLSDFLKVIINTGIRFFYRYQAVEIDWGGNDH